MGKVIESKFVIKGEDQGAQAKVDLMNKRFEVFGNTLKKIEEIPFLDPTKFEKVGHIINIATKDFERLLSKISGVSREAEKLKTVLPSTQWTGRAAEVLRRRTEESLLPQGYRKVARQMLDLEKIPEPEGRYLRHRRIPFEQFKPQPVQPVVPEEKKKHEPPWAQSMRKFFEKAQSYPAMLAPLVTGLTGPGAMIGGVGKVTAGFAGKAAGRIIAGGGGGGPPGGGGGAMAGMAGMAALGTLGVVAGVGLIAGMVWKAAEAMAQPYIEWQKTAAPLFYAPIGKRGVEEGRAVGARYGYEPTEMVGFQRQMHRVGGAYAPEQFAKLRYAGLEMEEAMPYMEAITRAGGAGGRGKADYEMLAKEIAIAIADKTKLPSVPQFLEQLVGLTSQTEQYLSDVSDETRRGNVALAKWGEEGGSALLRGARGAQTWGAIGGWIAGNQDPAQKTLLYSIMARDDKFRGKAASEALTQFPDLPITGKGPMGVFEYQWMREQYGATAEGRITALRGLRERVPNLGQAALILHKGAGISLQQATKILKEVEDRGQGWEETEKRIKEKTGESLEDSMKTAQEREGDLRKKLATAAEAQLKLSERIAPDVTAIKAAVLRFVERTVGAPEAIAEWAEPVGDAISWWMHLGEKIMKGGLPAVGKKK